MTPIVQVIPDFDTPLHLHQPEYEEYVDPEGGTKFILINKENSDSRWVPDLKQERTLEDSARIAARTAEVLYELGMDVEQDEKEQTEWLKKHPYKAHPQEINRLPIGTDPTELIKIIEKCKRNNAIYNTDSKYDLQEACYKQITMEDGTPVDVPIFEFDVKVEGRLAGSRQDARIGISARYGLDGRDESGTANPFAPMPPQDLYTSKVALKLSALLNEYDKQVVKDAVQLRTYITNRLIEISACGNTKDELRALELLGKVSDVGLFVEKSEINVVHTNSASLEHAIKDKINRLLGNANIEIEDAEYTVPAGAELRPLEDEWAEENQSGFEEDEKTGLQLE